MTQTASSPLNWGLIPLLVIAVAITLSIQLEHEVNESEEEPPPDHADYYIRGAKLSTLGPNGKVLYQVQAEEILHFRDRSAALTNMTAHYQGGPAGIWRMESKKGRIPPGGDEILLQGDVKIKGSRPEEGIIHMNMSEALILPQKGLLKTDSPVTIIEPGSKISAVGMQADILKDVISLHNDVQVQYAW